MTQSAVICYVSRSRSDGDIMPWSCLKGSLQNVCSLSSLWKRDILKLLIVIVMRILELEGPSKVILHDLQLRVSIPPVSPNLMSHGFGLKHLLCAWEVRSTFCSNPGTLTVQEWPIWRMRVTPLVPRLSVTCQSQSGCLPPRVMGVVWKVLLKVWDVGDRVLSHSHLCPTVCQMESLCLDQAVLSFFFFICLSVEEIGRLNPHLNPVWFLAWCPWTDPILNENSELRW